MTAPYQSISSTQERVASIEMGITKIQGHLRSKINKIKAELAFLERINHKLNVLRRTSGAMLRDEEQLVNMLLERAEDDHGSMLDAFTEEAAELVAIATKELQGSTNA